MKKGDTIREQILVATPGMVTKYLKLSRSKFAPFRPEHIKARCQLSLQAFEVYATDVSYILQVFVADEADQMIETENFKDALEKAKQSMPRNCQFVLCSATWKKSIIQFADR